MTIFIFLVRRGDSPKIGDGIRRELIEKVELDIQRITDKVVKLAKEVNPQ